MSAPVLTWTPEVRERLESDMCGVGIRQRVWPTSTLRDLKLALSHIDALEAERERLVAANESWHVRVTQEKQLRESYEERAEAAEARVAVLAAALKNLHATTLVWAEKPHTAQDTANWMKAMQDAAGALEGGRS